MGGGSRTTLQRGVTDCNVLQQGAKNHKESRNFSGEQLAGVDFWLLKVGAASGKRCGMNQPTSTAAPPLGIFRQALTGKLVALVLLAAQVAFAQQKDFTKETPAQRAERMEWFNEARFGMFIHWGLYAIPAGEWKGKSIPSIGEWIMEKAQIPIPDYEPLAQQFNPVKFDARAWVRTAKAAGMKYIVITSKHHDGFGLWPSDQGDWNIKRTPFGRDPLMELAKACRAEGIKLCFYHSIMDWHHPDYAGRRKYHHLSDGNPDMDRYVAYLKGQLKELITRYGPIGILWFDGEWEPAWTHERGVDLYNYVRSLQPDIIVNNRVGKGRAGMSGMDKGQGVGDYGTPEQEIPPTGFGPDVIWESCMTMNNTWGYRKDDNNWKSTAMLVRNLIDCASKGGNYLLNVGPTAEGLIPAPSVERLGEIGKWMKVNHESIYDTHAGPFKRLPWGRCTTKVDGRTTTLYLHVFNWPENGKMFVPGLKNAPARAYLLADKNHKKLETSQNADGVVINVPTVAPDEISSTVMLIVRGKPEVTDLGLAQDYDGSVTLPAEEAKLSGKEIKLETNPGFASIGYWMNPEESAQWQFKVTKAGKFEVVGSIASLAKSAIEVRLGEQKLRGEINVTGDWKKFRVMKFGTLDVPAGDNVTLSIHGIKDGWEPINVKSISLKPVK